MAEQRVFSLADVEEVPGPHLNRVRVRLILDPKGDGQERATLSTSSMATSLTSETSDMS